jgi:hypothetical protein
MKFESGEENAGHAGNAVGWQYAPALSGFKKLHFTLGGFP